MHPRWNKWSNLQKRPPFPLALPAILLVMATVLLAVNQWDLQLSRYYFDAETQTWPLAKAEPWVTIDRYFVYPGVFIGIGSLIYLLHCLVWKIAPRHRQAALILGLTLLIGPGLLVNASWKPFFSRPRPREVIELGGTKTYRPAFGFGEQQHNNSSFPSGHASIGFFLLTPAFVFRQRNAIRLFWLWGGIGYGSLMSLSRVVQGAHYISDVMWSLGIVYFTAWGITYYLESRPGRQSQPEADLKSTHDTSPDSAEWTELRSAA